MLYLQDGELKGYDFGSACTITYVPKSGRLCCYRGMSMSPWDIVYSVPDFEIVESGVMGDPEYMEHEAVEPLDFLGYAYQWEGEWMSYLDYEERKEAAMGGEPEEPDNEYSWQELLDQLGD
ncbi:MAG: hypothetical protein IK115_10065 [Lachnospiraceae bacterium]|nr:hypothetical protein [Lachnospiraceae bacterium]